jgi:hypothetical protein
MSKRAGSATSGVRPDSAATGMRAAAEPSQPIDGIPVSRPNGASQRSSASQQGASNSAHASQARASQASASQNGTSHDSGRSRRPPGPGSPAPPRPPSWGTVIATTVRLWFQRKVRHDAEPGLPGSTPVPDRTAPAAPGRGAPGAGRGTLRKAPRRRAALFGLAIVVFAAGALTIALAEHQGGAGKAAGGSGHAGTVTSPAAVQAAQASRNAAAAWVATQVSHDVIVGCDPAMCTELQGRGFPAGDLLPVTAQSTDPMGSQVVVATATLRSQFGSRLADIYAPAVIASFGTGTSQVVVRVEAPDGSQAYLVTQRADLLARQGAGRQLVHNRLLHVSGTSRRALLAGRPGPHRLHLALRRRRPRRGRRGAAADDADLRACRRQARPPQGRLPARGAVVPARAAGTVPGLDGRAASQRRDHCHPGPVRRAKPARAPRRACDAMTGPRDARGGLRRQVARR